MSLPLACPRPSPLTPEPPQRCHFTTPHPPFPSPRPRRRHCTAATSRGRPTRSFVFDFRAYDDPDDDQRWSTWHSVEPLCRGPEPRPDWVVTSQAAVDTELGILKTGKEADVFLARARRPRRPGPSRW